MGAAARASRPAPKPAGTECVIRLRICRRPRTGTALHAQGLPAERSAPEMGAGPSSVLVSLRRSGIQRVVEANRSAGNDEVITVRSKRFVFPILCAYCSDAK